MSQALRVGLGRPLMGLANLLLTRAGPEAQPWLLCRAAIVCATCASDRRLALANGLQIVEAPAPDPMFPDHPDHAREERLSLQLGARLRDQTGRNP